MLTLPLHFNFMMMDLSKIISLFCTLSVSFMVSVVSFEIKCNYIFLTSPNENGYNCKVSNLLTVTEQNTSITEVSGVLTKYTKTKEVGRLFYLNIRTMEFVPVGYSKYFPDLDNLWIENCPINEIFSSDFENPKNFKILAIIETQIKIIDKEVFSGVENLEKLYLDQNQIQKIHDESFSNLKNLQVLKLSGNKLSYWSKKLLENCHELNIIQLSDNKLKIIDVEAFHGLGKITKIELRANMCIDKNLPGDMWYITNLNNEIKSNCGNPMEDIFKLMAEENQKQKLILTSLKTENGQKNIKIQKDEREIFKLNREIENLKKSFELSNREIERALSEKKEYQNEIDLLRLNHSQATSKIDEIFNKTILLEYNLLTTNQNLNETLQKNKNLETENKKLKAKVESLDKNILNNDEKYSRVMEINIDIEEHLNATLIDKNQIEEHFYELQANCSVIENENRKLKDEEVHEALESAEIQRQIEEQTTNKDHVLVLAGVIITLMIIILILFVIIIRDKASKTYDTKEFSVAFQNDDQLDFE